MNNNKIINICLCIFQTSNNVSLRNVLFIRFTYFLPKSENPLVFAHLLKFSVLESRGKKNVCSLCDIFT